jgi:hypothetical protein
VKLKKLTGKDGEFIAGDQIRAIRNSDEYSYYGWVDVTGPTASHPSWLGNPIAAFVRPDINRHARLEARRPIVKPPAKQSC